MKLSNILPRRTASLTLLLGALLGLGGCQESVEIQQLPPGDSSNQTYTGNVRNEDVNRYKNEVWEKLRGSDRCGSCHIEGGAAPTPFVHQRDVNAAHDAALTVVDTRNPENSAMVTKVAGGHQCWLGSAQSDACAAELVVYLRNWLFPTDSLSREEVTLTAPTPRDPDTSIIPFPETSAQFQTTVWPLLVDYCSDCHADSAPVPQAPFFAQTDVADIDTAYDAARGKMDLNNAANSRIVVRLRDEFHNCPNDCASDAAELEAAVQALADLAAGLGSGSELDLAELPNSKALYLNDGTIASGGGRFDENLIALYKFDDGEGDRLINDSSGVGTPADLQLYGTEGLDYRWLGGWGIEFLTPEGRAQATPYASAKLHNMITTSGEYTLEAWLIPANVTQGADEATTIISYSAGNSLARNFTLRQRLYNYDHLNRSSNSDGNGNPMLSTADEDEAATTTLQHVAVTFDPVNGRRLYVNGQLMATGDNDIGANLADWDDSFALMIGNEATGNLPWSGSIRFLAIHSRALTPAQVETNFDAGVGERYYLLFNIDEELARSGLDLSDAYIMMEVMQFDSYSYLFSQATFISLDENFQPADLPAAGIPIRGIRIGINGKEAAIGQPYLNLDTVVSESDYGPRGQLLSEIGSIISLENGPERDEFFLTFDNLNGLEDQRVPGTWDQGFPGFSGGPTPDIGLRTFAEINATMARLTGVDPTLDAIGGDNGTYTIVKQQLPSDENISGFVSAHQVGVAQLAIEYCHNLVEDAGLRSALYPGFDFDADAATITTATWQSQIIDPMIERFIGTNLASQPDTGAVRDTLTSLITDSSTGLARCDGTCPPEKTRTVVKASCAALLGSAVVLVQ